MRISITLQSTSNSDKFKKKATESILDQLNYAEFRASELARLGRKLSGSRSWKITGILRTTRAALRNLAQIKLSNCNGQDRQQQALLKEACRLISKSGLFDEHFYRTQLEINNLQCSDPLIHFIMEGWQIGLSPNFLFDCSYYTSQIEALDGRVNVNPLLHYILEGHSTDAATSLYFDPAWYRKQYTDVRDSGITPLAHFLQFGLLEGRSPAGRIPQLVLPEVALSRSKAKKRCKEGTFLQTAAGRKTYDIIICLHEASRTGAPMLGLNLAERLKQRGFNCLIITLDGGELLDELSSIGDTIDLSNCEDAMHFLKTQLKILRDNMRFNGKPLVIFNSAKSASAAVAFGENQFKRITLVHEFMTALSESEQRQLLINSEKLVFPNRATQDHCTLLPFFNGEVRIIPQGLLDETFAREDGGLGKKFLEDNLGIAPESFVVLGCGSVEPRKGVDIFVQAANQILRTRPGEFEFVWIGEERSQSQEALKWVKVDLHSAGIEDRVHFVGQQFNLEPYFAGADLFALPSRQDPLPCVLHLAMSAALPVVAFQKSGGAEEIVALGCGTLVDYGNSALFAEAIVNYKDRPERRVIDGNCGRELVTSKYNMNNYVEQILQFAQDTPTAPMSGAH